MSKIVDLICARNEHERRNFLPPLPELLKDLTSVSESYAHIQHSQETRYRIEVTIGAQVFVPESLQDAKSNALSEAVDQVKLQVVEAIFGEFREDFMMIDRALSDRDVIAARSRLSAMYTKMFVPKESESK